MIVVACVLGAHAAAPGTASASKIGLGLDGADLAQAIVVESWVFFAGVDLGYLLLTDDPMPAGLAALELLVPGVGSLIWAGSAGLDTAEGRGVGALGVVFSAHALYALIDRPEPEREPFEWELDGGLRLSARPTKGGMLGRAAWRF